MDSCFIIMVSELNGEGKRGKHSTHLDSIWLDEDGPYRRVMEIVKEYEDCGIPLTNETITSRRGIIGRIQPAHYWTWESSYSDDTRIIVSVEKCPIGTPMIRSINPVQIVNDDGDVETFNGHEVVEDGKDGDGVGEVIGKSEEVEVGEAE
jgi:hypothetical protein